MGGAFAGGIAAVICFFGLPVEAAILLALPMVLVQALLLDRVYAMQYPTRARNAVAVVT